MENKFKKEIRAVTLASTGSFIRLHEDALLFERKYGDEIKIKGLLK
jgi:hypothetical protein